MITIIMMMIMMMMMIIIIIIGDIWRPVSLEPRALTKADKHIHFKNTHATHTPHTLHTSFPSGRSLGRVGERTSHPSETKGLGG